MLQTLQRDANWEVVGLLTTFNETADRVAMHGVRRSLVRRQANTTGLPLHEVMLPWPCSNADYESRMNDALTTISQQKTTHLAFGDLYLEEIRDYRIQQLTDTDMKPVFPIWCGPSRTRRLADEMVNSGLKAVVTCLDPSRMPKELIGREFDASLLADLPSSVDPCGENGEFHTYCYAGPHQPFELPVVPGEVVTRDGFVFCDLVSNDRSA